MKIYNELENLIIRYPVLSSSIDDISEAYALLEKSYENNGKLLICGNGGSASDADHIVGELMKSFSINRSLQEDIKEKIRLASIEKGEYISSKLQPALPAIALTCHNALSTAFSNDVDPLLVFAQQVLGYGVKNDVLLAISTSGNSENVINAIITAKAIGIMTIGLTGNDGGKFKELCDTTVIVNAFTTPEIQELHLPIYHTLCTMLEKHFFEERITEEEV